MFSLPCLSQCLRHKASQAVLRPRVPQRYFSKHATTRLKPASKIASETTTVYSSDRVGRVKTLGRAGAVFAIVNLSVGGILVAKTIEKNKADTGLVLGGLHTVLGVVLLVLGRRYMGQYVSSIVSGTQNNIHVTTLTLLGAQRSATYKLAGRIPEPIPPKLQDFVSGRMETKGLGPFDAMLHVPCAEGNGHFVDVRGRVGPQPLVERVLMAQWVPVTVLE